MNRWVGTALARWRALEARDGDWPHTYRLLPWSIAAFMVMVFIVPFDAMSLPFHLPVDSKLDRFVLVPVVALWLSALAVGGRNAPRLRPTPINWATGALLFVAIVSVGWNVHILSVQGEVVLALKQYALLVTFILFMYLVATSIRPGEARAFAKLIVVLGCLTAIGTIYEYRTDVNLFYKWAGDIPGVGVAADPAGIDAEGRRTINGPTGHGLAVAAMMAMVLPFAINLYVQSTRRGNRRLYGLAIAILFAGGVATVRKTSVIVPLSALLVMTMYRPRQMIRLLPLGLVVVALVHVIAPGAMGGVRNQLDPSRLFSSASSEGRTEDYKAVGPDIHARPVLGRGYGTYDPLKYRFIDNQYLLMLIETGVIGTGIYVLLILLVVRVAHPAIRGWDPIRGPPALAAAAAAVAFGISNLLFDVLAFPHVPYLFGFAAGLGIACGYEQRMAAPATAADKRRSRRRSKRALAVGWQSSTT